MTASRSALACLVALGFVAMGCNAVEKPASKDQTMWVYVGTYTGPKSKGVHVMKFDTASGTLSAPQVAGEVQNPSFLHIHPSGRSLYTAGEMSEFQGKKGGAVSAFGIDSASGKLKLLNQQTAGGGGSCFVSVDPAGKVALVANYGGGSVSSMPIKEDGSLGEPASFHQHAGSSVNAARQKAPHAHCIVVSPEGKYAYACDLGLDKVLIYKIDAAKGAMTPNDPASAAVAPGSGPRHLAFHPTAPFAYVINEMLLTMTVFKYDPANGSLTEVQTLSTLPEGVAMDKKFSCAEVQVHPSGKFVYGSNRGHDSITCFTVDPATGKLSFASNSSSGGKTPRNFRIDPTGQYLFTANQGSDNIVVYKIDQASGALTPTGATATVGSPVCIKFLPVGK